MATKMSHETPTKAEKMLERYEDRLREILSIDLEGLKINEIRELAQGFELEMQTLDSKKASVLSTGTRAILKDRYFPDYPGLQDYNRNAQSAR